MLADIICWVIGRALVPVATLTNFKAQPFLWGQHTTYDAISHLTIPVLPNVPLSVMLCPIWLLCLAFGLVQLYEPGGQQFLLSRLLGQHC